MSFVAFVTVAVLVWSALQLTRHGFHELATMLAVAAVVIVGLLALLAREEL